MPAHRRMRTTRFPAARSSAAPAWRWPCRGWNRFPSGAASAAPTATPRACPSGSPRCSWPAASTPNHWWAKGAGADDGAGQDAGAAGAAQDASSTSSAACSTRPPPASAFIRARRATSSPARRCKRARSCSGGISMDQVLANHIGQETVAAEPGPGLRAADHRLSRDEFLDGLQLAHLLAERDLAGADGGLSVAGVRQPVRQPRQPAEQEHPRPRAGAGRRASAGRSARPTRPSSTNI